MRSMIIIAAALSIAACTAPKSANEALLDAGYTNIQTGGPAPWSCSDKDTFSTKFTATGPTGRQVQGVVCAGVFKGDTIRLTHR